MIRLDSKVVSFCQKVWADFQTNGHSSLKPTPKKRPLESYCLLEKDIGKGQAGRKAITKFFQDEIPRVYREVHGKDTNPRVELELWMVVDGDLTDTDWKMRRTC